MVPLSCTHARILIEHAVTVAFPTYFLQRTASVPLIAYLDTPERDQSVVGTKGRSGASVRFAGVCAILEVVTAQ